MIDLNVNLPVDIKAPAKARHALDDLRERIPPDVLERFRLAVSELVTNAILHAGLSAKDGLRLIVRLSDDRLRVEIMNPGPQFTTEVDRPDPSRESGRGLLLVQRAADRWGLKRTDEIRQWFEIDLPESGAASVR
jgi:anti-sigma regulatory factor (Ser/Thr protein kinase)